MSTLSGIGRRDLMTREMASRVRAASLPASFWVLTIAAGGCLVGFVVCSCFGLFDGRTINGANVWAKPAKFYLSVGIQSATLAWAVALLDTLAARSRSALIAGSVFVTCSALELLYITIQAARGEASHFNNTSQLYTALYALMGLGALSMVISSAYLGIRLLRRPGFALNPIVARGLGLGLVLAAFMVGLSGAYMSVQNGHWVGSLRNDAGGLRFVGWSTKGGDWRVPHFFAMHTAQAVAIAGWLARKSPTPRGNQTVTLAAVAMTLITVLAFVQASLGRPFLDL